MSESKRSIWACQTFPHGTGGAWQAAAAEARRILDARTEDGSLTWTDVLLEQTFRALAATDPRHIRQELTSLAATVTAWVEDIDRKAGK